MEVDELVLISQISNKSQSITSCASVTRGKVQSSQLLIINIDAEISVKSGTCKMARSKLGYWIVCLASNISFGFKHKPYAKVMQK